MPLKKKKKGLQRALNCHEGTRLVSPPEHKKNAKKVRVLIIPKATLSRNSRGQPSCNYLLIPKIQ